LADALRTRVWACVSVWGTNADRRSYDGQTDRDLQPTTLLQTPLSRRGLDDYFVTLPSIADRSRRPMQEDSRMLRLVGIFRRGTHSFSRSPYNSGLASATIALARRLDANLACHGIGLLGFSRHSWRSDASRCSDRQLPLYVLGIADSIFLRLSGIAASAKPLEPSDRVLDGLGATAFAVWRGGACTIIIESQTSTVRAEAMSPRNRVLGCIQFTQPASAHTHLPGIRCARPYTRVPH